MKKINNQTLEEQIKDTRKHEKAHALFLKLYPKHISKKSWDTFKYETTNPSGKSDIKIELNWYWQ